MNKRLQQSTILHHSGFRRGFREWMLENIHLAFKIHLTKLTSIIDLPFAFLIKFAFIFIAEKPLISILISQANKLNHFLSRVCIIFIAEKQLISTSK